jgi:hypothetical protein
LEKLPKQTQQELCLGDLEQKPHLQQIQELTTIVKTRQDECEKKFWKLQVGDHEIVLRDYAVTIVSCLQKIGDIAIPVWATIGEHTVVCCEDHHAGASLALLTTLS